jgi:hypothetical protein
VQCRCAWYHHFATDHYLHNTFIHQQASNPTKRMSKTTVVDAAKMLKGTITAAQYCWDSYHLCR